MYKLKKFIKKCSTIVNPDPYCIYEVKFIGGEENKWLQLQRSQSLERIWTLTQGELAKRMGLSGGSVSAVENGTNRVTSEFAKKFKRAVGITDSILIDIQNLQKGIAE